MYSLAVTFKNSLQDQTDFPFDLLQLVSQTVVCPLRIASSQGILSSQFLLNVWICLFQLPRIFSQDS